MPNADKMLIMISQIGKLVKDKKLALIMITPYIILNKIVRYDILIPPQKFNHLGSTQRQGNNYVFKRICSKGKYYT